MSVLNMIRNPYHVFFKLPRKYLDSMPDDKYLKFEYRATLGKKLNLENPETYTEKLQWLKLYYRKPELSTMVDKCDVKEYVSNLVGAEHVIPMYGVWNKFDDIDFDSLPNSFVLKCTHDSGGLVVCKDKRFFDADKAKTKIDVCMQRNFYYQSREWAYKNVRPRIIAEKYIPSLGNADSIEYKTTCFDGKVGFVTICQGPAHVEADKRTNDSFTPDFKHMPWYAFHKNAAVLPEKPAQWDALIAFCEKLSKDIPVVRIDCYIVDGKIYYGEYTFYTWGGLSNSIRLNGTKS